MLNNVILMGRVTRDLELRRTGSGTAVTSFSLAVERDFKTQSGEKETDFFDVVAWRNTAEFACKYLTKGQMVVVSGSMQNRDWTDRDGGKRRTTEVIANHIYFAGTKPQADSPNGNAIKSGVNVYADGFQEIDDDGNLPF